MSVNKSGGDAINAAEQYADSDAEATSAAVGGPGFLFGVGGNANSEAKAESLVDQYLDQYAKGGDGGDDNVHADTTIVIG